MPAIPAPLVSWITRGEFIDLWELLPEYIGELFLKSQQLSKHAKKPPPIKKPTEWMLAFSCFVAVMAHHKPSLASRCRSCVWCVIILDVRGGPMVGLFTRRWLLLLRETGESLGHDSWALAIGTRTSQDYKAITSSSPMSNSSM